jgi:hypothetical protein
VKDRFVKRSAGRRAVLGALAGTLLFTALLAILLFAGELSASKFIYVDF